MNILLDYMFPISVINPTPQASTAFLKQACLVVKPKAGVTIDEPTLCLSMADVLALTDNLEAQSFFDAGMTRLYVLPSPSLDLASLLTGHEFDFFTLLISSDFTDVNVAGIDSFPGAKASLEIGGVDIEALTVGLAGNSLSVEFTGGASAGAANVSVAGNKITVEIESGETLLSAIVSAINLHPQASLLVLASTSLPTGEATPEAEALLTGGLDSVVAVPGMTVGPFKGVVAVSSDDVDFLRAQAVIENRCAFYSKENGAKNMVYAFGKLLSNALNWTNQQFITMPFADDVNSVGMADYLFSERISFVLSDSQYGKRLGLLACGGKAIVAPYIVRNLMIDLQSEALSYVSANQPGYTKKHATLMQDNLQKVIDGDDQKLGYVGRGWLEEGKVDIRLEQDNFVGSAYINIAEPGAIWRFMGELRQTL